MNQTSNNQNDDGDQILYPPFPTDTATIPRMLQLMADLRDWIIDQRFWANETMSAAGSPVPLVPDDDDLPKVLDFQHYANGIAIHDITYAWVQMRELRMSFDQIVRVNEDCWDSRKAVHQRLRMIHWAMTILRHAFVTPEQREFRQQEQQKKAFKIMRKMLKKVLPEDAFKHGDIMPTPDGSFGFGIPDNQQEHLSQKQIDALFSGVEPSDEDDDEDDDDLPGFFGTIFGGGGPFGPSGPEEG